MKDEVILVGLQPGEVKRVMDALIWCCNYYQHLSKDDKEILIAIYKRLRVKL